MWFKEIICMHGHLLLEMQSLEPHYINKEQGFVFLWAGKWTGHLIQIMSLKVIRRKITSIILKQVRSAALNELIAIHDYTKIFVHVRLLKEFGY